MEVKTLSQKEYVEIFSNPYHVFNRLDFNLMNAEVRGINILCLGFRTKKYKLGIIGVVTDGKFRSPFSAPFGGFSYIQEGISLETIDKGVEVFVDYCKVNNIGEIEIVLPPFFYEVSFISKLSNVLFRKKFAVVKNDLNYSIHLSQSQESYIHTLRYNARKNLSIALSKNFNFYYCQTLEEKELAYGIIKMNREAKGYPLRMTFDAIRNTINIIKADFFLVSLDKEYIAAAMVFHVAKDIVQVIYWGDLPEYGINKTMNFLSFKIVEHYQQNTSIQIIDIGPSTEDSIPNYGLCDFKESIGCSVYPKQTWHFKLQS